MESGDHVVSLFGGHYAFFLRQVSSPDWVLVGDWDLNTRQLAGFVKHMRANIPIETFRLVGC
jgi:hypothetical protein